MPRVVCNAQGCRGWNTEGCGGSAMWSGWNTQGCRGAHGVTNGRIPKTDSNTWSDTQNGWNTQGCGPTVQGWCMCISQSMRVAISESRDFQSRLQCTCISVSTGLVTITVKTATPAATPASSGGHSPQQQHASAPQEKRLYCVKERGI